MEIDLRASLTRGEEVICSDQGEHPAREDQTGDGTTAK